MLLKLAIPLVLVVASPTLIVTVAFGLVPLIAVVTFVPPANVNVPVNKLVAPLVEPVPANDKLELAAAQINVPFA